MSSRRHLSVGLCVTLPTKAKPENSTHQLTTTALNNVHVNLKN